MTLGPGAGQIYKTEPLARRHATVDNMLADATDEAKTDGLIAMV